MNCLKIGAAALLFIFPVQAQGGDEGKPFESAWDALVREDPSTVNDETISEDERILLEDLTLEEAQAYLEGGNPNAAAIRIGDPQDLDLGGSNVATGMNALGSLTTGLANTAMGYDALGTLTTGVFNTAVGRSSLRYSNGFRNTAVGQTAMRDSVTGGNNTAVGDNALRRSISGGSNTAVGAVSLHNNMSHNNTAIGAFALRTSTTGFGNIALGRRAGFAITTGSNNIMIGNEGTAGDTGIIRIGNDTSHHSAFIAAVHGATPSGATETVIINSAGELGTRSTTSTITTCPGGPSPVTCSCLAGGVIVGGGGECRSGTHVMDASFPSSATSWEVSCVFNEMPIEDSIVRGRDPIRGEVEPPVTSAYAVCIP